MVTFTKLGMLLAVGLVGLSVVHADETGIADDGTKVLNTQVVRTVDAKGVVTEKRIVKKIRARTVVDFEEASIEGKVKKPNAAYLLHGADLDFKHLYRVKSNQHERIVSSYEYVR
ncbi:MAG: hypothetical protein HY075_05545 [Deltaproteobacteria bacterium]|nr:hypothetical protein [Deltaproteobacteria bacterium]